MKAHSPRQNQMLAGQPVGRRLKIEGFDLPEPMQQRLLEMGLTVGAECSITRYAPLGDPMEITVRGYWLVLRAAQARGIHVQGL